MPLLKGKENIGHNIKVEEETKPKKQAIAIALHKANDMTTAPNTGMPNIPRSVDGWKGRTL
jgi:hypothetical protein